MSARAPTATHRQSSSLISSPSSFQFTPCSAHARQANDRTMVMMAKTRDRTRLSGLSADIPITMIAACFVFQRTVEQVYTSRGITIPEYQHRVQTPKRKGIRQCVFNLDPASLIGNYIQITSGIGFRVVGSWRQNSVEQRQQGGGRF